MRVPQRLQIVARCLVVLTGNFLNIVANSSFIDRSSNKLDVRQREQRQCQFSGFRLIMRKRWFLAGIAQKGRLFQPSLRCDSVQKWPKIGKLVQIISTLVLRLPSWQQLGYFGLWLWRFGRWVADFDFGLFRQDRFCVKLWPTNAREWRSHG